jgi:hypothetical protein
MQNTLKVLKARYCQKLGIPQDVSQASFEITTLLLILSLSECGSLLVIAIMYNFIGAVDKLQKLDLEFHV